MIDKNLLWTLAFAFGLGVLTAPALAAVTASRGDR